MSLAPEVNVTVIKLAWEWIKDTQQIKVHDRGTTDNAIQANTVYFEKAYKAICKSIGERVK
jgi:hypothetical protein